MYLIFARFSLEYFPEEIIKIKNTLPTSENMVGA